jgi:hypothetical protein
VGVGRSREDGRQLWCGFNASVSAREGRLREVLPNDEADATSSSWLHGKEARHGVVAWRHRLKERRHCGGEMEETIVVGLTRILLGQKMKKTYTFDPAATNE